MLRHVLICGTDVSLLKTRGAVLRSAGFDVLTVSHPEEIETFSQLSIVDALVICHTLTPEQQQAAVAILNYYRPKAKSIVMMKNTTRETTGHPDAFINSMDGPKTLIQTLDQLLQHTHNAKAISPAPSHWLAS